MISKKFDNILEQAFEQMQKDREIIMESYDKFSNQVVDAQDYAVNGQNLNKCLELLTKQTGQLLEFAKLCQNEKKAAAANLSDEEKDGLYEKLAVARGVQ